METAGFDKLIRPPDDAGTFDHYDPANVSPMVAYLATADCPFTGETFHVEGDTVIRYQPYIFAERIRAGRQRWNVKALVAQADELKPKERRGGRAELRRD
jgi:hypothetical protein